MDKRKKRRGGFYWNDNNEPFVSVTNVLGIIDRSALQYWFGKQVYLAMVRNPGMSEKEALAAPYQIGEKAMSRGSTVHSIVESYKTTGIVLEDVPIEFRGYASAFKQWISDYRITVVEHEKSLINLEHRYAGTLDLRIKNNNDEDVIVDVKTGKGIYDEAWLQLSAYAHGDGIPKPIKTAVILLGENGTYKFEYGTDQFEYFLAAKKLWEWKNHEDLVKVGYLKK